MTQTYDQIGLGYASYRQSDPSIERRILAALGAARTIVNVGAGTGSYEPRDRAVVAVEPSAAMIAQRAVDAAPVTRAAAEALPLADRSFDAAMSVLTVHHWHDLAQGGRELCRVADATVVLTFEPSMTASYWLSREYIPASSMFDADAPSVDEVAAAVGATSVEVVPVPHDCRDGFMGAYWRRPAAYFDPGVRAAISSLARLDPADVEPGLAELRKDLASGAWQERHAELLAADAIDLGYRLVVRAA